MSYPSYGSDERASLLQKVQTKDDFSAKKWRCMSNPARAMETLTPYAVLEVGIMTARDLTEREGGLFNSLDTTPDSFVQVILDDMEVEKCKTPVARGKKEPTWMYQGEVELLAPMSMVRFQMKDDRPTEKADIGFFDICVGDIPYGKPIEGWFELRFQESLLYTSTERYANHCFEREEVRTERTMNDQKDFRKEREAESSVSTQIPEDDKETKIVVKKQWYTSSKDRTMDAFQACVHSTAEKAEEYGLETISKTLREGGRKRRCNAGEVYVSLRLNLLVSKPTSLFAYALEPPIPLNYGSLKAEVVLTKKIDVQRCCDDIWEVKVCVLDDALLCCFYGFRYLVTWRSLPLSLLYLLGLLLCCWKTYLNWAIIPLLLAISLIVNAYPEARKYMTRGGHNAALTEEGFKHVAAWRDGGEVLKFVERLLKQDMKATLDDPKNQFKAFAAQCVRDGTPTVSLEQLRLALLAADFVQEGRQSFAKGDLVWVDGRFPAKVDYVTDEDMVKVSYQKTLVPVEQPSENVRPRQLLRRADTVPSQVAAVPGMVTGGVVEAIYPIIEDLRHASLPAINMLTQILIWKKAGVTMGIVLFLLVISALFTWAAVLHRMAGEEKGNLSHGQEVAIAILRNIDNTVCALVVVGIFMLQASWMTSVSSFFKILGRSGRSRVAPTPWQFFKEDSEAAEFLRSQGAKHAQEHPHGSYFLPHMATDAGSASAMYQANYSGTYSGSTYGGSIAGP